MKKYTFKIKNQSINKSIIAIIVESSRRHADIKLETMLKNAYYVYKRLNKCVPINISYNIKLSKTESVNYLPNDDTVKMMLEHEEKYFYPYLIFNVDYGNYYRNCVNYENEINLNRCFIIDNESLNYRGLIKQEYNDYIKLKDVYKTK